MRSRVVLLALVALLAAGCASGARSGQDTAGPATTAAADPATVPSTTAERATAATRPAPPGVIPERRRQAAPELQVKAFDGRTVTLGGFRGQPVVVNFFESW
jgi:hypothetical protein